MKKIKNLSKLAFVGVVALSMGLTSCKKDNDVKKADDCAEVAKKYSEAASAFAEDPTNTENCKAYKKQAEEYIKSSCVKDNKSAVESVKTAIEALPCN